MMKKFGACPAYKNLQASDNSERGKDPETFFFSGRLHQPEAHCTASARNQKVATKVELQHE